MTRKSSKKINTIKASLLTSLFLETFLTLKFALFVLQSISIPKPAKFCADAGRIFSYWKSEPHFPSSESNWNVMQNIAGLQNNLQTTQLTVRWMVAHVSELFPSQLILFTCIQWRTDLMVTGCPLLQVHPQRERRWGYYCHTYLGLT